MSKARRTISNRAATSTVFVAARIREHHRRPAVALHRGFKAGAQETKPNMKILGTYVATFDDVQKVAEAARGQIARNATVLQDVTAVHNGSFGNKFHVSGLANKGLVMTPVNALPRVPDRGERWPQLTVGDQADGSVLRTQIVEKGQSRYSNNRGCSDRSDQRYKFLPHLIPSLTFHRA